MAYLFTSESVSEGHPDKVADQISELAETVMAQIQQMRAEAEVFR